MKKRDGWQIPLGALTVLIMVGLIHQILGWMETYPIIAGSMIAGTVAISVGLITFSGVRLTLKHATQRMHFELENSRNEAEEERQYAADKAKKEQIATMRREVYLEAVSHLVRAHSYLGSLGNVDFTAGNIFDGLKDFQITVSKIAIVGDVDTVLIARTLAVKLAQILLKAAQILSPAIIQKGIVAVQQKIYDAAHADMSRIVAAMAHHNETRPFTPEMHEAFAALQRSHQGQMEISQRSVDAMRKASGEILAAQVNYYEMLKGEAVSMLADLDTLLFAVRSELGLESDEKKFSAQSVELFEQMRNTSDEIIKSSMKMDVRAGN